jgi:protein TonB
MARTSAPSSIPRADRPRAGAARATRVAAPGLGIGGGSWLASLALHAAVVGAAIGVASAFQPGGDGRPGPVRLALEPEAPRPEAPDAPDAVDDLAIDPDATSFELPLPRPLPPPRVPDDPGPDALPPRATAVEGLPPVLVPLRVAGVRTRPAETTPPPAVATPLPEVGGGRPARLVPVASPRVYPLEAVRRGLEGTSIVVMTIGADGRVLDVDLVVSSGSRILDRATVDAARRWRFEPPGTVRRARVPFRYER